MSRWHKGLKFHLEYELIDKDGRLLRKGRQRANSFVGNIIAVLWSFMTSKVASSSTTIFVSRAALVNTSNIERILVASVRADAPAGDASFGIRVGTGTTDVGIAQSDLAAPIAHGTAAGQLSYGITTVEIIAKTATTWTFRIIRPFTNATSASITINEVGLFFSAVTTDGTAYQFMLARDLILGLEVPPAATVTLRYVISYTV